MTNKYGLEKGLGSIYLDKSLKGMRWGKPIRHNTYRAEVWYDGVRYRKRDKNPFRLASWLLSMKEKDYRDMQDIKDIQKNKQPIKN